MLQIFLSKWELQSNKEHGRKKNEIWRDLCSTSKFDTLGWFPVDHVIFFVPCENKPKLIIEHSTKQANKSNSALLNFHICKISIYRSVSIASRFIKKKRKKKKVPNGSTVA